MNLSHAEVDFLLSPQAVRMKAQKMLDHALDGHTHFEVNLDKMEAAADYVLNVIQTNYPEGNIPFHSRWGHFKAGDINRNDKLELLLENYSSWEKAKSKLDLVIVSVLLDAGAGKIWSYKEEDTAKVFNRSEGLGVASFHMFLKGYFSKDPQQPFKANAEKLVEITSADIAEAFQVSESNPLNGLEGRAQLIKNLGLTIQKNKNLFPNQRPSDVMDYLKTHCGEKFPASEVLKAVLKLFGGIWPGRLEVDGTNLGDVWHYDGFDMRMNSESLVPFHKLSQWLSYSLIEPMEESGLEIYGVEDLTGLAEYRNGGFFVDFGILQLKNPEDYELSHNPSSTLIIEWRALTVALLDQIAELIQNKLGKNASEFPLAKVLEGGTWWAGRKIALEKRSDGTPPIKIDSDGTVF